MLCTVVIMRFAAVLAMTELGAAAASRLALSRKRVNSRESSRVCCPPQKFALQRTEVSSQWKDYDDNFEFQEKNATLHLVVDGEKLFMEHSEGGARKLSKVLVTGDPLVTYFSTPNNCYKILANYSVPVELLTCVNGVLADLRRRGNGTYLEVYERNEENTQEITFATRKADGECFPLSTTINSKIKGPDDDYLNREEKFLYEWTEFGAEEEAVLQEPLNICNLRPKPTFRSATNHSPKLSAHSRNFILCFSLLTFFRFHFQRPRLP